METSLQLYLDKAFGGLAKHNITLQQHEEDSKLAELLEEVVQVDEPKVLAVAKVISNMGAFNALVRDNVQMMHVSDRYQHITESFDSIREDSKVLLEQIADGRIDKSERLRNFAMRITRGTPHQRFNKIKDIYNDVTDDGATQLDCENVIMNSYMDFRFALKDAEGLALQVLQTQKGNLDQAQQELTRTAEVV
ncbi:MAG: cell surface protein, partial [Nanoarchaeota archaeon]